MPSLSDHEIQILDFWGDSQEFARLCLRDDHGLEGVSREEVLQSINFESKDTEHSIRAKCSHAYRRWAAREGM